MGSLLKTPRWPQHDPLWEGLLRGQRGAAQLHLCTLRGPLEDPAWAGRNILAPWLLGVSSRQGRVHRAGTQPPPCAGAASEWSGGGPQAWGCRSWACRPQCRGAGPSERQRSRPQIQPGGDPRHVPGKNVLRGDVGWPLCLCEVGLGFVEQDRRFTRATARGLKRRGGGPSPSAGSGLRAPSRPGLWGADPPFQAASGLGLQ